MRIKAFLQWTGADQKHISGLGLIGSMFVVRCPECRHTMRYHPTKTGVVSSKTKKCVYCGRSFKIHPSYVDSRIVREEEKNTTTPLFHSAAQEKEFCEKLEEE